MSGKTAHGEQCSKSRALIRLIYLVIDIECEQQRVILKGLLQSDRLKKHMVTIGIDQLLSNCAMYEHIYL